MKLKCDRHKRRVHVLAQGKTIHRSDGTQCPGAAYALGFTLVVIGDHSCMSRTVWLLQHNKVRHWRKNHVGKGNSRTQFQGRIHGTHTPE